MVKKFFRRVVVLGGIGFVSLGFFACAKKTTVVLLPDPDGTVGHITVTNTVGSVEMTNPGETTVITDKSTAPAPIERLTEAEIESGYSTVLSILPAPQEQFILYFILEKAELTEESKVRLPQIARIIKQRETQEIRVTGHTDTSGEDDFNRRLSERRAALVTQMLIEQGVNEELLETRALGEQIPLIRTNDNTYEPRNRRVEVIVW